MAKENDKYGGFGNLIPSTMRDITKQFGDIFVRGFQEDLYNILNRNSYEESENEYTLTVDVPGFKKDEIEITIPQGRDYLEISAEKKTEEGQKKLRTGLEGSFKLPLDVDPENFAAKLEDGVLTVTLPKVKEKMKPVKKIPVE